MFVLYKNKLKKICKNNSLLKIFISLLIIMVILVVFYSFVAHQYQITNGTIINTIFSAIFILFATAISIIFSFYFINKQLKKEESVVYLNLSTHIIGELDINIQMLEKVKEQMGKNLPLITGEDDEVNSKLAKIILSSKSIGVSISDKYYIAFLKSGLPSKISDNNLIVNMQRTYLYIQNMKIQSYFSYDFASTILSYRQSTDITLHTIAENQNKFVNKTYDTVSEVIDKNIQNMEQTIDLLVDIGKKYGHTFTRIDKTKV